MSFQVKICGITSVRDARVAAQAGADAIGLNFYEKSPRHVPDALAQQIADGVPGEVRRVGVFVNEQEDEIIRRFDLLGLDYVQLHGAEPPATLFALGERPAIRAFRWQADEARSVRSIETFLTECRKQNRSPAAILIDAFVAGSFGGTGQRADWDAVARFRNRHPDVRLILAGGLTPENVAEAVATVRPDAVDVASGVEHQPGRKDPDKVVAFVQRARQADRL